MFGFLIATRGLDRRYVELGRITRDKAIREWVKITAKPEHPAEDGTVGEIIDRYVAEEVPRRLRLGKIAKVTADEYCRQAPRSRSLELVGVPVERYDRWYGCGDLQPDPETRGGPEAARVFANYCHRFSYVIREG
jgi:hypothetical protein